MPLPLAPRPREPMVGVWADVGRWMVGELEREPVELAVAIVARKHRERVRAAGGGR